MNVYNNNEQYNETMELFNKLPKISRNEYIYSMALCAASNMISCEENCEIIMNELNQKENSNILNSFFIQSSIINMYVKLNRFAEAEDVFNRNTNQINDNIYFDNKDILHLYSSIMDCYSKMGNINQLLLLFNNLNQIPLLQNQITVNIYCIVLNACSHYGYISNALSIFEDIKLKCNHFKNAFSSYYITMNTT